MVQGALRSWHNQPNRAEGAVVAVAAQCPSDRATLEVVYPGNTAAGVLGQAASVSEYGVLRWEVVRVEPQPEREWPVPVLIRSPCDTA